MAAITTITDKTGNGYDLKVNASPFTSFSLDYFEWRNFSNETRNVPRIFNEGCPMIEAGNSSLFHGDHEFHIMCGGRQFSTQDLWGTKGFSTAARNHSGQIDINGKLVVTLGGSVYTSDVALFRSNSGSSIRRYSNKTYYRTTVDFTNDIFKAFVNGGEVPMTLTSGSGISSLSPTFYDMYGPFCLGSANDNNNSVGQVTYFNDVFFARVFKRILTDSEAFKLSQWLLKI